MARASASMPRKPSACSTTTVAWSALSLDRPIEGDPGRAAGPPLEEPEGAGQSGGRRGTPPNEVDDVADEAGF